MPSSSLTATCCTGPARTGRTAFGRVLVNHYMNAYSLLPWHRPPEDGRMALADYRGIMMVAGDDPYAWKGTVEGGDAHVRTFDPAALQTE